ncbi:RICIN domain-containing protein [Pontivivens ytuae]|uniref:RICIN domain-containing protein n=1 Tax=Pontivivens ytuae TaxID=2789856 RepID=A0A7S9LQR0_9RHOB|nr:RICIN domain-containing protein [Pontivivens ytuae]QPH53564.1 RICIN domain-containing protein [Pontivivens ytuae]
MQKRQSILIAALLSIAATTALAQTPPQIRLADPLDYPGEGYCIDVVGVGDTARADLPLVVHNCLPERGSSDRIAEEREGRLFMPAFDACVTAFGVTAPLPGSPVVLRPCGAQESFLPADRLQLFDRTAENRLRLRGSDLCLAAGPDSARTFSPNDRWRTLTMEPCDTVPIARSAWD